MNKCSSAVIGALDSVPAGGLYSKCDQMSKTVEHYNSVRDAVQNSIVKKRQRPQNVPTYVQNLKEEPSPTACIWTRTHQRRWTVDLSQHETFPVIIVEKTTKKPQPPQRDISLLHPQPHSSFKLYSCPSVETFSPSSTSATSFCLSPPSVPTSIITGHDPLGWKLQPKSSFGVSRERTKRLSLQIPLPEVQTPSSQNPETSSKPRPAIKPKPSRRRHSEPTAFLKSMGKALPVLNPEEFCTVLLKPVTLSDELDDVFDKETRQQGSGSAPLHKIPPPVPEKTAMARRLAHLIASSGQTSHL